MSALAVKRIGVLTNETRPGATEIRSSLLAWLAKRDVQVLEVTDDTLDKAVKEAELIVSIGGDGTILSLAGKMVDRSVPVLGVNAGSLGFLTEVRADELYDELKSILNGHYAVQERMLLSATVRQESGGEERRFQALNDIVINREGLTRYIQVRVDIGGEQATRFSGDGVIVSTPTGSTAYSLSAGGPIVHPDLDHLIVTAICPHASAMRSLVVPGSQTVRIRVTCDQAHEKAILTADGQIDVEIDDHSLIEVTRSEHRFKLVKSSKRSYFQMLQEKFKLPA